MDIWEQHLRWRTTPKERGSNPDGRWGYKTLPMMVVGHPRWEGALNYLYGPGENFKR